MTPNAKFIYNGLAELPVREFFATPAADRIFTNPAELLLDEAKERFVKILADKGDIPCEKQSDFERFSAFVSGLELMWGSGERELFLEELSQLFDYESKNEDLIAAEMWREFSHKISEGGILLEDILRTSGAELVRNAHLPVISREADHGAWVRRNIEAIEKSKSRAVAVDISNLKFEITDRYHAEEAYSDFCKGNGKALDTALSGLMFSIFDAARKSNICLFVYASKNLASAKKMIDYFTDREVMTDVVLFASGKDESASAAELCGVRCSGKRQVSIDCGIVYEQGDTAEYIAQRICGIARVYPVGRLVIGGSLTDSPAFAARHRVLRRGVCIAADRLCPDRATALECARRIIENSARYGR